MSMNVKPLNRFTQSGELSRARATVRYQPAEWAANEEERWISRSEGNIWYAPPSSGQSDDYELTIAAWVEGDSASIGRYDWRDALNTSPLGLRQFVRPSLAGSIQLSRGVFIHDFQPVEALPLPREMVNSVQKNLSFSIADVAKAFGVSRQALYNWIDQKDTPSPSHLENLEKLFKAARLFEKNGLELGKPRRSLLVEFCEESRFQSPAWEDYIHSLLEHTRGSIA